MTREDIVLALRSQGITVNDDEFVVVRDDGYDAIVSIPDFGDAYLHIDGDYVNVTVVRL